MLFYTSETGYYERLILLETGSLVFQGNCTGKAWGKIWKDCKVWSRFQFYFYFRLNIIHSSGLHNAGNRLVALYLCQELNYCWQPNVKIEVWVGCQRTCTKKVWECGQGYIGILRGLLNCLGCAHFPFLRVGVPCAWERLHLCHWKGGGVLVESISQLLEMIFLKKGKNAKVA